jgi:hypothetical protein
MCHITSLAPVHPRPPRQSHITSLAPVHPRPPRQSRPGSALRPTAKDSSKNSSFSSPPITTTQQQQQQRLPPAPRSQPSFQVQQPSCRLCLPRRLRGSTEAEEGLAAISSMCTWRPPPPLGVQQQPFPPPSCIWQGNEVGWARGGLLLTITITTQPGGG